MMDMMDHFTYPGEPVDVPGLLFYFELLLILSRDTADPFKNSDTDLTHPCQNSDADLTGGLACPKLCHIPH